MAGNIQHEEINLSLNNDKKAFEDLSVHFKAIALAFDRVNLANKELNDCLKRISKQLSSEIPKLSEIVNSISLALTETQKANIDYVELINNKIVLSLNGQLEQIKAKQKLLDDYKAKTLIEADRDQKRKNPDPAKQKELYQAYEQSKKDKQLAAQTFTTQYQIYISEKNQEFCSMWKHYLNTMMYQCALGLEHYTKSVQIIHTTDLKQDSEVFLSKLLGNQKLK